MDAFTAAYHVRQFVIKMTIASIAVGVLTYLIYSTIGGVPRLILLWLVATTATGIVIVSTVDDMVERRWRGRKAMEAATEDGGGTTDWE